MSFATLAVISLVAIVGPLLALPRRWHLPIILGELAAGIWQGLNLRTGAVASAIWVNRSDPNRAVVFLHIDGEPVAA